MYNLKLREELVWGLIVAVTTYLLQVLVEFKPEIISDWRAWGIALAAGMVRAGAAALLVIIGKGVVDGNSNT